MPRKTTLLLMLAFASLALLLGACSQAGGAPLPTATLDLPPTQPPPTAIPTATALPPTPTDEPTPTAIAVETCVACHTDKDALIANAKPVEPAESESKGVG